MTNKYSNEQQEAILSTIGMRRKGTPKEVSELALFLASDDSNYITGQVIGIDGGMLI
jgi:3-oxoacyl-[acyl-carrier protein] reductase